MSTLGCSESSGSSMLSSVVGPSILPSAPEDANPSTGKDARCVGMIGAAGAGALVDVGSPSRLVTGVIGEGGDRESQAFVAGPSGGHAARLSRLVSDRGDTGFSGEVLFGLESSAIVAELGEDLSGIDASGSGEGHESLAVGQCGDGMLEQGGEVLQLIDERLQHSDQRAYELALGFGLGIAGEGQGCGSQASRAADRDVCGRSRSAGRGRRRGVWRRAWRRSAEWDSDRGRRVRWASRWQQRSGLPQARRTRARRAADWPVRNARRPGRRECGPRRAAP